MNLYEDIPGSRNREMTELLLEQSGCRIERIVSRGQTTPEGMWYDQSEDEWVSLLQGEAALEILSQKDFRKDSAETPEILRLYRGDTLWIRAHEKHRVIFTSDDPPCIWLCVFVKSG